MSISIQRIQNNDGTAECAICLDEFNVENMNDRIITQCGHTFHASCLLNYSMECANTRRHVGCPICRTILVVNDALSHIVIEVTGVTGVTGTQQEETYEENLRKRCMVFTGTISFMVGIIFLLNGVLVWR